MCLKVSWFENIYPQALVTIRVPKKDCHVPKTAIHKIQLWTSFSFHIRYYIQDSQWVLWVVINKMIVKIKNLVHNLMSLRFLENQQCMVTTFVTWYRNKKD